VSVGEVGGVLRMLGRLGEEGRSVIFISHKLGEVLEVCDEVVVLRDGGVAGRVEAATVDRHELARMMVGREVNAPLDRIARTPGSERLVVANLTARDALEIERVRGLSFSVVAGAGRALVG